MFLLGRKTSELSPADIELIQEAASALARCGERLEQALGKLRSAETVLDVCSDNRGRFRQEAIEQYRRAWREADKARYVYIVQREAIGFRTHKFADQIYPLPALRNLSA